MALIESHRQDHGQRERKRLEHRRLQFVIHESVHVSMSFANLTFILSLLYQIKPIKSKREMIEKEVEHTQSFVFVCDACFPDIRARSDQS